MPSARNPEEESRRRLLYGAGGVLMMLFVVTITGVVTREARESAATAPATTPATVDVAGAKLPDPGASTDPLSDAPVAVAPTVAAPTDPSVKGFAGGVEVAPSGTVTGRRR